MKYDSKVRWRTIAVVPVLLAMIAGTTIFNPFSSAKNSMSTPTINCGTSTQTSITVIVQAGTTGAPAGFSLQWMKASDYAAYGGWRESDDPLLCKASFSGNANLSRYNLDPNEAVEVNVGDFIFDNGASSNCAGVLECNTEYVFRAFAHASNSLNRSAFTPDLHCSTLPCFHDEGCTLTIGYWQTHNDAVCTSDPSSPLCVVWPTNNLTLGTVNYNQTQLLSIFNKPAAGNGLIVLAHQLIAAKLNIAAGAAPDAGTTSAIAAADALIGGLVVPPVGSGTLAPAATSGLTTALKNFNEGTVGPGHCD